MFTLLRLHCTSYDFL
jgi:putative SOS response-associated peptidase YedK